MGLCSNHSDTTTASAEIHPLTSTRYQLSMVRNPSTYLSLASSVPILNLFILYKMIEIYRDSTSKAFYKSERKHTEKLNP